MGNLAHILEYGAAPHIIAPKKKNGKKKLKFQRGGDVAFAREVHHPGIAGRPFMRPAWEMSKKAVIDRIAEGVKKEMKGDFGSRYKQARMR